MSVKTIKQEESLLNLNLDGKRGVDETYDVYKARMRNNKHTLKLYSKVGRERFKSMFPNGVDASMFEKPIDATEETIEEDVELNDFLNDPANNKEPHEMGDTHEYIKGGLTMPKENTNKLK
tara:strand:+ start:1209 stop:1571 length:363 start_codon:yes stop_codon:yes gene_type:complete